MSSEEPNVFELSGSTHNRPLGFFVFPLRAVRLNERFDVRGRGMYVAIAANYPAFPNPLMKLRNLFQSREALLRLVRIKARFMRQREKRFAHYHSPSWFINQLFLC